MTLFKRGNGHHQPAIEHAVITHIGRDHEDFQLGKPPSSMNRDEMFVIHYDPVWRDRSDFIINAALPEKDSPRRFEQLFAKQIGDDRFEVCCIPFFLYDIALGDVVATSSKGDRNYVLEKVIEPSGRYVFRVWFGETFHPRSETAQALKGLGALIERSSRNLLAVDAIEEKHAQLVADFLAGREKAGQFVYETGRS